MAFMQLVVGHETSTMQDNNESNRVQGDLGIWFILIQIR